MAQTSKSSVKNSNAPKVKDLSVQQRRFALLKQKQCDSIALNIVMKLIDCEIEEDAFLLSLKYLNQCHYQDVVEERAIGKLCGYPVCGNLMSNMPQKKFHISSKLNKVYDITDRKNYCSNYCYQAGNYIKDQMLTSPLWFRDKEQIPNFHLLPKTEPGIPGIEIDQGLVKADSIEPNFVPVTTFTFDVLDDISEDIRTKINVECEVTRSNTTINQPKIENFDANTSKITAKFAKQSVKIKKEFDRTIINTSSKLETNFKPETSEHFATQNESINHNIPKTIDKKIGFDRTIISKTKIEENLVSCSETVKSILSNRKKSVENSKNLRKSVSFSKETKPESNDNTIFGYNTNKTKDKYKVTIIDDANDVMNGTTLQNTSKNMNLLGDVKETTKINKNDNIPKYIVTNIDEINVINGVTQDVINDIPNTTINMNLIGDVQDISKFYNFSNNDNSNNNIDKTNSDNKQTRLNRLKNSATYKSNYHLKMRETPVRNISDFSIRLKNSIDKWVTLETIIFLYGVERVKQIISDKTFSKYVNKKKALDLDELKQKKYEDLCKRLNLAELADRKFDESVTGKKRLPLPKFEELKTQAESMDLKVQAFYSGCYELIEDDENSETESMREDIEEGSEITQGTPAVLPLVESKDINATRRRIFLTSLSRTIPSTCEILKQCPNYLLSDIKQLIDTFEFTADNIVFKSAEWKFVAFIVIRMLAIRDEELQEAFTCEDAQSYLISLKKEFYISDINEFLNTTIEIHKFLENCSKSIDYLY